MQCIQISDSRLNCVVVITAHQGYWVPDGENIKLPVAIKVLNDGGQSQGLLDEARIMASVTHPCCLSLLAVCLSSQVMLVSQLMSLGSLLDYIRKNRSNIGSKPLLTWSTQIAQVRHFQSSAWLHRCAFRFLLNNWSSRSTYCCVRFPVADFGIRRESCKIVCVALMGLY